MRPYDLRASVTQDMKEAGIHQLELRYLTAHSVNDILNQYTGLDPADEMAKYFARIAPLLAAIRERAVQLKIPSTAHTTTKMGAESREGISGKFARAG